MIMKTRQLKTYGMHQSSSNREVYGNTILLQGTRKTSNKQPNSTPLRCLPQVVCAIK